MNLIGSLAILNYPSKIMKSLFHNHIIYLRFLLILFLISIHRYLLYRSSNRNFIYITIIQPLVLEILQNTSKSNNNNLHTIKIINFLVITFLPFSCTSFLLKPNILLDTLFSDTLNLCSAFTSRDQVSHSYKINRIIDV